MLMMMSKCNLKGAFQSSLIPKSAQFSQKPSDQKEPNLNTSPISTSQHSTSKFQIKTESGVDEKQNSSLVRSKFDKKTNFAIVSTLID